MTLPLLLVMLWYFGALFLLWQVSLYARSGMSWGIIFPYFVMLVLMLVHASLVYYEYTGTPTHTVVRYLWIPAFLYFAVMFLRQSYKINN